MDGKASNKKARTEEMNEGRSMHRGRLITMMDMKRRPAP